jgi:hypothetical protein
MKLYSHRRRRAGRRLNRILVACFSGLIRHILHKVAKKEG